MKSASALFGLAALLAATAGPAQSQVQKGQVTVGSHEVPMKKGMLYAIKVEGKDFHPHVAMHPTSVFPNFQDFTAVIVAEQTRK